MRGAINKIVLSENSNRTMRPTLSVEVGQTINVIFNDEKGVPVYTFQMSEVEFKQWAKAFNLMAEAI